MKLSFKRVISVLLSLAFAAAAGAQSGVDISQLTNAGQFTGIEGVVTKQGSGGPYNGIYLAAPGQLLFYDQTQAEITAGVTPLNFNRVPGDPNRYETNLVQGTVDMTVGIQAAVNQTLAGGAPVHLPCGTYLKAGSVITGTNINVGLEIYGDSWGCSIILTNEDVDVFSLTQQSGTTTGRVDLHDLQFQTTLQMTSGAGVRYFGSQNSVPSPVRSFTAERVHFQGQSVNGSVSQEFRYAIFLDSPGVSLIDDCHVIGVTTSGPSATSVAVHVQSTGTAFGTSVLDIRSLYAYQNNISIELANTQTGGGGIEGVHVWGGDLVGPNNGIKATNANGSQFGTNVDLKVNGTHINSLGNPIDATDWTQVFLSNLLLYVSPGGSATSQINFTGVQFFSIDNVQTFVPTVSGSTADVNALTFNTDSSSNITAVGTIANSQFNGKSGTTKSVIAIPSAANQISVGGSTRMSNYASWLPRVSSASYTGWVTLDLDGIAPLTADEIQVSITPSGGTTGGGTLNLNYVQAKEVVVNATAGTITAITPFAGKSTGGTRTTLQFPNSGIVVQNNSGLAMPSGSNFTSAAGGTLDIYQESSTVARAVASTN